MGKTNLDVTIDLFKFTNNIKQFKIQNNFSFKVRDIPKQKCFYIYNILVYNSV